jgi:very-short-patch-repair endonuclease
MYKCKYCGKEFEKKSQLAGHATHCKKNTNYDKNLKACSNNINKANSKPKIKDFTEYNCQYCGKLCIGKNSLVQHELRCKKNPEKIKVISNFFSYNEKIKSGEINKEYTNQFDKAKKLGLDVPIVSEETRKKISDAGKKRKLSVETREKIRNTQKKNYCGKSKWYTQIQNRLSYAEQYFLNVFPNANWHYHVNRYFLDVAYPSKKVYIEIDGSQHKNDPKVVLHDIERTNILNSDGWKLITRIYWPDFIKLTIEERAVYIENILNELIKLDIKP